MLTLLFSSTVDQINQLRHDFCNYKSQEWKLMEKLLCVLWEFYELMLTILIWNLFFFAGYEQGVRSKL